MDKKTNKQTILSLKQTKKVNILLAGKQFW